MKWVRGAGRRRQRVRYGGVVYSMQRPVVLELIRQKALGVNEPVGLHPCPQIRGHLPIDVPQGYAVLMVELDIDQWSPEYCADYYKRCTTYDVTQPLDDDDG